MTEGQRRRRDERRNIAVATTKGVRWLYYLLSVCFVFLSSTCRLWRRDNATRRMAARGRLDERRTLPWLEQQRRGTLAILPVCLFIFMSLIYRLWRRLRYRLAVLPVCWFIIFSPTCRLWRRTTTTTGREENIAVARTTTNWYVGYIPPVCLVIFLSLTCMQGGWEVRWPYYLPVCLSFCLPHDGTKREHRKRYVGYTTSLFIFFSPTCRLYWRDNDAENGDDDSDVNGH